jgi:hypothetical protein
MARASQPRRFSRERRRACSLLLRPARRSSAAALPPA